MKRSEGWWKTLDAGLVAQQPRAHVREVLSDLALELWFCRASEEFDAVYKLSVRIAEEVKKNETPRKS